MTAQDTHAGLDPNGLEASYVAFEKTLGSIEAGDRIVIRNTIAAYLATLSSLPKPISRTCPNCGVLEGMECKPACPRRIMAEMDARALTQTDAGKEKADG